jgi:hypothetical protein
LIEFGSCSSASSTAGLAADQVGSSGLFFKWRNLLKRRSFLNIWKINWFWRVSNARSEGEKNTNRQISKFGFHCVAMNIESLINDL